MYELKCLLGIRSVPRSWVGSSVSTNIQGSCLKSDKELERLGPTLVDPIRVRRSEKS